MDPTLLTILGFGLAMSAVALVGGLFVLLPRAVLDRWVPTLVAFAAGSLLGGALFHMLPKALERGGEAVGALGWTAVGFALFLALDLGLEWHHCRRGSAARVRPLGPLLLLADGAHNLLGGLAVGAIFTVDVQAGIAAWTAAALHELPQELGDFGAIVHAGYSRRRALLLNLLSGLTFPLGGVLAWSLERSVAVEFLVALGAGNFLYVAAADLVPEVKGSPRLAANAGRFAAFAAGLGLLWVAGRP
jgi:zinc and cadmium transporter